MLYKVGRTGDRLPFIVNLSNANEVYIGVTYKRETITGRSITTPSVEEYIIVAQFSKREEVILNSYINYEMAETELNRIMSEWENKNERT